MFEQQLLPLFVQWDVLFSIFILCFVSGFHLLSSHIISKALYTANHNGNSYATTQLGWRAENWGACHTIIFGRDNGFYHSCQSCVWNWHTIVLESTTNSNLMPRQVNHVWNGALLDVSAHFVSHEQKRSYLYLYVCYGYYYTLLIETTSSALSSDVETYQQSIVICSINIHHEKALPTHWAWKFT